MQTVKGKVTKMKWIGVEQLRSQPKALFVFGDNMAGWGRGGQAIIRDEPNAVGVPTKWKPATTSDSYFCDEDFAMFVLAYHGRTYFQDLISDSLFALNSAGEFEGMSSSQILDRIGFCGPSRLLKEVEEMREEIHKNLFSKKDLD